MLKSAALFLSLLLTCAPVLVRAQDFADAAELRQWLTYYYATPEPKLVAKALSAASAQGLMKNGRKVAPTFGFLAGVMSKNHALAPALAKELVAALPAEEQPVVVLGLWYSDYPQTKALLAELRPALPEHQQMLDHLLSGGPAGLLQLPLEQGPWVLDALWGYFMATGDDAPVARIIDALAWVKVEGDLGRLRVAMAARWSLVSNAIQHPRVMALCRKEAQSRPAEAASALRDLIAEAERDIKAGKKG